jgi:methionyl-tRNA synthetase
MRGRVNQRNLWPADFQIIGKDILKFHCIYWPAFLMALELPLPKRIIAHAHWQVQNVKMSKSKGNVVDPNVLISKFGLDAVRYFLLREGGLADDSDFSEELLTLRYINELADTFGNLVLRCLSSRLHPNTTWPRRHQRFILPVDTPLITKIQQLPQIVHGFFESGHIQKAVLATMEMLQDANKYFHLNEPWYLMTKTPASDDAPHDTIPNETPRPKLSSTNPNVAIPSTHYSERRETVLYITLEAIRMAALCLSPVLPSTMDKLLSFLHIPKTERNPLAFGFGYQYHNSMDAIHLDKNALVLFPKHKVTD